MKRTEAESKLAEIMSALRGENEAEKELFARMNKTLANIKQTYKADHEMDEDFDVLVAYYSRQAQAATHYVSERKKAAFAMFEQAAQNPNPAPTEPVRTSSTAAVLSRTASKEDLRMARAGKVSLHDVKEVIDEMLNKRTTMQAMRSLKAEFERMVNDANLEVLHGARDYYYTQLMSGARKDLTEGKKTPAQYDALKKEVLKNGADESFSYIQDKIGAKPDGRVLQYEPPGSGQPSPKEPSPEKSSHHFFRRR